MFRTDKNKNPTAFTTDIAHEAGLVEGTDYSQGDSFEVSGHEYFTACLLGDPLLLTIKVIDKLGFRVGHDPFKPRWSYINMPYQLWSELTVAQKVQVIGSMYECEGGTEMRELFPK